MTSHRLPCLFTGQGASYCPDVPRLDAALTKGLFEAGYSSSRVEPICTYATTLAGQAQDYAFGRLPEHMRRVVPLEGARIAFAQGVLDLVLDFGDWLFEAMEDASPRDRTLLRDVRGDVVIFERYLALRPTFTRRMIERFLSERVIHELVVGRDDPGLLHEHAGEVWITGEVRLDPLLPEDVDNLLEKARP